MGVCYRLPGQDKDTDEWFSEGLRDVSKSTALVLIGDFNKPEKLTESIMELVQPRTEDS